MKRLLLISFLGVLAIVFTGCASTAHIQKDKHADFSKYKTYAWVDKPDAKENGKNWKHDISEVNVRNAVNTELQKKGWRESASDPDIIINYELLVEKNRKQQQDPVYTQPYSRSYFNRRNGKVYTFYYPSQFMGYDSYTTTVREGTVTITMIDSQTDKAVWQGWTTSELDSHNLSTREIDRSVKAIFKNFDTGN
ncbi:MAG TPA: DUF4136 domain-containing protein [Ferruginibacter sp.]|nr:DUF4136 domain-containing protein [Ferruginibacter sp.]